MNVTLKGEYDKVAKTTGEGGEFYELAKKAEESSSKLSDRVNQSLQDTIGAKTEDEIYNKLVNGELSSSRIDALRFSADIFKSGKGKLSPDARKWLQGASNALDRYDTYKRENK